MTRNIGETSLRRKRRAADPMQSYDALPAPLRRWLAQAALPWSPASAKKIWVRAMMKGLSEEDALGLLFRSEERTLARDKSAIHCNTPLV